MVCINGWAIPAGLDWSNCGKDSERNEQYRCQTYKKDVGSAPVVPARELSRKQKVVEKGTNKRKDVPKKKAQDAKNKSPKSGAHNQSRGLKSKWGGRETSNHQERDRKAWRWFIKKRYSEFKRQ